MSDILKHLIDNRKQYFKTSPKNVLDLGCSFPEVLIEFFHEIGFDFGVGVDINKWKSFTVEFDEGNNPINTISEEATLIDKFKNSLESGLDHYDQIVNNNSELEDIILLYEKRVLNKLDDNIRFNDFSKILLEQDIIEFLNNYSRYSKTENLPEKYDLILLINILHFESFVGHELSVLDNCVKLLNIGGKLVVRVSEEKHATYVNKNVFNKERFYQLFVRDDLKVFENSKESLNSKNTLNIIVEKI